ncbi:MAG: helix-turn-helix domain-containing protein [Oscillospiraceae bacterium]|nr:helix-turn-helix domain-containing protein [Oscillospiraceae bacterium]
MGRKTTDDLRQELMDQPSIETYLSDNRSCFMEQGILDLLESLRERCGLPKAEIARRSGMSEVYLHQVFSGRRNPSRDRLLALCVGMGASLEEANQLLRQAAYAQLYPRLRRDAIISHGLAHRHSLVEINESLFMENEKTLA